MFELIVFFNAIQSTIHGAFKGAAVSKDAKNKAWKEITENLKDQFLASKRVWELDAVKKRMTNLMNDTRAAIIRYNNSIKGTGIRRYTVLK